MERKLRGVESLPDADASVLLELPVLVTSDDVGFTSADADDELFD
jgi:hypothetical protein